MPSIEFQAQVVSCMKCGAARENDTLDCKFCHASFTLHERDMQTICPSCLARVSNSARFCHRCATAIMPLEDVGELSAKICPACSGTHHLTSRALHESSMPIFECQRCAGIWVETEVFNRMQEKTMAEQIIAIEQPKPIYISDRAEKDKAEKNSIEEENSRGEAKAFYRRCPDCNLIMARKNYARISGIILDICSMHGVWFEGDELSQLLHFVRQGGMLRAVKAEVEHQSAYAKTLRGGSGIIMAPQKSSAEVEINLTPLLKWFFQKEKK